MGFFWTGPSGYNVLVRDSRAIESWGFQNVGRASWVMGGGRTLRFLNFFFFFFFSFYPHCAVFLCFVFSHSLDVADASLYARLVRFSGFYSPGCCALC